MRQTLPCLAALALLAGCAVAPRPEHRAAFAADADSAMVWFEQEVPDLQSKLEHAAGYAVFPHVVQWGSLFGGGVYGRAVVRDANGDHVGWGMLNNASIGLQAGIQDYKMLVLFEDERVFRRYTGTTFEGAASGAAVGFDAAHSARATIDHGLEVYQAAHSGMLIGGNLGIDLFRYEPVESDDPLRQRSVALVQH